MKTGSTASSISVSWGASTDNVAVAGYGLYRNGSWAGSTTSTSATISGLSCGSSYTLAVDAYDAAANRSPQLTLTTTTSACPPPADTTPPTAPSNLSTSGVGQTTATLNWTASSDNVGVVGYRTFRNGATVATVSGTSSTLTGLTCGSSYTLAVEAYDTAGNISSRPSVGVSTAACTQQSDPQAPSVPQGMAFGAVTETTVALVWNASTDNVGVVGYRLYRDDVAVGTVASPGYTSGAYLRDVVHIRSRGVRRGRQCLEPRLRNGHDVHQRLQCPASAPAASSASVASACASGFWGCECVGGRGWWVVCQEGDGCRVCECGCV